MYKNGNTTSSNIGKPARSSGHSMTSSDSRTNNYASAWTTSSGRGRIKGRHRISVEAVAFDLRGEGSRRGTRRDGHATQLHERVRPGRGQQLQNVGRCRLVPEVED